MSKRETRRKDKLIKAFMPLFVAEYLADTSHLTTVQHGAYMLIIMHLWQTGKHIPEEDLPMITRMGGRWPQIRRAMARLCHVTPAKIWSSHRVDHELEQYKIKIELKSKAGKASAESRARHDDPGAGIIGRGTQMPGVCSTDVEHMNQQERNIQIQMQNKIKDLTGNGAAAGDHLCDYSDGKAVQINSYDDCFAIDDPIRVAMAVTGETDKRAWGCWIKMLAAADKVHGRERGHRLFRDTVAQLWGEMRNGERPNRPGAVLNARLKKVLQ